MQLRHALLVLPALQIACSSSSDNQIHGQVFDASTDTVTDNPPDGSDDGGVDAATDGHKPGHDARPEGASTDGPSSEGSMKGDASGCTGTGTIALAGGTTAAAFAATSVNGGSWSVTPLSGTTSQGNPAFVPFSSGFLAVFTAETTDTLDYSLYASSTWSTGAAAIGSSCTPNIVTAIGAPALASIGTTLHSVYLGMDYKFFHGSYTGTSWDCENDVLTPSGGTQSFGPSAPAAASVGSSLIAVFDGMDGNLYAQSWTSGSWSSTTPIVSNASVGTTPPTLIALNGGSSDLLVLYEQASNDVVYWSARSSGTWSTPAATNALAYTLEPVSAAPLAAGAAVVAFLGTDGNPYGMIFDPATSSWSAPAAVLTGGSTLTAPPTVATGVCGPDAIAAVVQPAGIELVTLSSGKWSTAPTLVSGTSGSSFATIATGP
jgi:hypothetical protein